MSCHAVVAVGAIAVVTVVGAVIAAAPGPVVAGGAVGAVGTLGGKLPLVGKGYVGGNMAIGIGMNTGKGVPAPTDAAGAATHFPNSRLKNVTKIKQIKYIWLLHEASVKHTLLLVQFRKGRTGAKQGGGIAVDVRR